MHLFSSHAAARAPGCHGRRVSVLHTRHVFYYHRAELAHICAGSKEVPDLSTTHLYWRRRRLACQSSILMRHQKGALRRTGCILGDNARVPLQARHVQFSASIHSIVVESVHTHTDAPECDTHPLLLSLQEAIALGFRTSLGTLRGPVAAAKVSL